MRDVLNSPGTKGRITAQTNVEDLINGRQQAYEINPDSVFPNCGEIYELWRNLCLSIGAVPKIGSIDLIDFPNIVPVATHISDGPDLDKVSIKFVGPNIVTMLGSEITGLGMEELFGPEGWRRLKPVFKRVFDDRCALTHETDLSGFDRKYVKIGILFLPFVSADESKEVTDVITVTIQLKH